MLANSSSVSSSSSINNTSVDDVVAVNIAASVAVAADLPIANNIANLAVSTKVQKEYLQTSVSNANKPVVGSTAEGRSITSYTVVSGDTLDSISAKFGITKDTIKWANNLTSDTLYEAQVLQILPIDGVIHDVVDGETIDSIAEKYAVDKTRLVLYNDLDISGLVAGTKIILPNATLPENERPGYIAPVYYQIAYGYYGGNTIFISMGGDFNDAVRSYIPHVSSFYSSTPGNVMTVGNCTWWAWERRYAMGRPLPGVALGNGGSWSYTLSGYGYAVDSNPEVGAVAESYGHVTVVESVNKNAAGNIESITISEMNNSGLYNVALRTIPASNIGDFWYIH